MASGTTRSGYKSVKNSEFTSVDFPSPDSPTIIRVNSNPFLTDLRWTWLGRLANPTYPAVSRDENCKNENGKISQHEVAKGTQSRQPQKSLSNAEAARLSRTAFNRFSLFYLHSACLFALVDLCADNGLTFNYEQICSQLNSPVPRLMNCFQHSSSRIRRVNKKKTPDQLRLIIWCFRPNKNRAVWLKLVFVCWRCTRNT